MNSKNQENSIFIRYYLQNEEKFIENDLNTYVIFSNPENLRVKEVCSSFPLKNDVEEYHLRFLLDDKRSNMKFWLDLPPDSKVPLIKNTVYIKALRLGIKKEICKPNLMNENERNFTELNNKTEIFQGNINDEIKDLNFNLNLDYPMKNDFPIKINEVDSNTPSGQFNQDYSAELNSLIDSFAQQLIPLMNSPNKNVVISPLSIFQALSLIANGARGETLSCILKVLRQADSDLVDLNNLNITFRNAFSNKNDKNIFLTSNALLFIVKPEYDFRSIASHDYDALVTELNDISNVNKWISKKTNGRINSSVSNIPPETNFLIINTVYFLGEWKYAFSPYNFYKDLFYPNCSSPYTVEYMKGDFDSEDVLFFKDNDSQIIQLPYKNPSLSATIILPKTLTPDDYIKKVDIKKVLLKKFQSTKINLSLPKFKTEFNVSLKEPLLKMGMEICFTDKADFSDAIKKEKIFIGDVIHNTFIDVNEYGTEATSVTSIFMKSKIKSYSKPAKEIKVNKPFIFLIRNSMVPQEFLFIAKIEKV